MEARAATGLSPAEGRRFGLVVGGAFLVLSLLMVWRGHDPIAVGAAGAGAGLVIAGLLIPDRLGPVRRAWMALGHGIGRVTTPIVSSIIYFVVLTPFGLAMRLLGHRPLAATARTTAWIDRATGSRRSNLERQF